MLLLAPHFGLCYGCRWWKAGFKSAFCVLYREQFDIVSAHLSHLSCSSASSDNRHGRLWKGTAKGAEPFAINEESCSCTSQTTFSAVQAEALDATEATQKPIKITVEMIGSSAAANRSKSGDAANAAAAIKPKASAPIYSTGPEGANFALALNLDLREDAKGRAIALQTVIELVCDMFVRDFLVSDLLSTGSTKEWYESNADKIVVVEATDAVGPFTFPPLYFATNIRALPLTQ